MAIANRTPVLGEICPCSFTDGLRQEGTEYQVFKGNGHGWENRIFSKVRADKYVAWLKAGNEGKSIFEMDREKRLTGSR